MKIKFAFGINYTFNVFEVQTNQKLKINKMHWAIFVLLKAKSNFDQFV